MIQAIIVLILCLIILDLKIATAILKKRIEVKYFPLKTKLCVRNK